MSSMKRLAVKAAFSHFNGYESNNNSIVTSSNFITLTTTTTLTEVTKASSSSFGANSAYNQNDISSSPQIGGLGLLHQQNLRTGTTINGGVFVGTFGGYSMGSLNGGAPVMGGINGVGGGSSIGNNGGGLDGSNNINGNVNILLGGAMLSVVTTVLCVVCYCCHRNIKKRTEAAYRQRWIENDTNMEIYSVEQCYETSGLFMESSEGLGLPPLSHEPPPSYDTVMVAMQETNHQSSRISPPPDYRSMNDVSGSSGNANENNPKFITTSGNANSMRIKKVLSAQSCCSLQRAEVENLFQLGVAAAAATSGRFGASAFGRKSLPYAAHNLAEGGRFINHHPYYQGCPLCGKFRYDDSMSLSSDSDLDQVVVTVDVNNANSPVGGDTDTCYCTPLQSPTIADDSNNNCNAGMQNAIKAHHDDDNDVDDRRRISTQQQLMTSSHAKFENTINNNDNVGDATPTTDCGDGTISEITSTSLSLSPAPSTAPAVARTNDTMEAASTSDNHRDTAFNSTDDVMLDLDSINDNGIIRLDMSKIIDKTGLPTYEAALKLESSGYV